MRKLTIVLGLVLCGLAAYLVFRPRPDEGEPSSPRGPVRSIERRAREMRPIAPGSVAPPGTRYEEPADGPESAATTAPQTVDVSVVVLSRRDQAPRAEQQVELAWWPPLEGVAPSRGVTDAYGSVPLRLEKRGGPRGDRCSVTVGTAGRAQLFRSLPLEDRIVVLIEECVRLHGRVAFRGVDPGFRAHVQLDEPLRGVMASAVMLGETQAGEDGAFELHTCPAREIPWVDVRVMAGNIAALRPVRWDELASEAGARIEVMFTNLVVRVVDEQSSPLAGAAVRAAYVGSGGVFPAVGTTDAGGEYRAILEPGPIDVIAALEGFASTSDRMTLLGDGDPPVVLPLRRLDAHDRLRGRVIREDGAPIDQALVTAAPAMESPEAAMAAFVQQRTGPDGRFELAIAGGRELSVTAYRRDLGVSDTLRFFADGREVELVIRAQGTLDVRIATPPGFAGFAGGRVEYVLVDRRFEREHHGHEFGVPFQVEELPAGDYNVFVFVRGWAAYAEGSVRIEPEKTTELKLVSREAKLARGTAQGAADLRLALDHPTWPDEVEQLWSEKIDHGGRFEIFLGEETHCPARVLIPGGAARRVDLRAGDGNTIFIAR